MDLICACATAPFPGAVAIVRVSGVGLGERLSPLLAMPAPRVATLKRLRWDGFSERALVLFFPSPGSYTGEDMAEFHLHGNPLLVRRFLEHLGRLGIRQAEPGEFTRRSLLNGKQDILEAEALRDMVNAATDAQLRMAQGRLGGLPEWIVEARAALSSWIARAEASMDYGEDEGIGFPLMELRQGLSGLREKFHVEQARAEAAHWLEGGIRVALVGRPNAGKSTLFNALAGEDRAIVTEIPGTTRDVLEVRCEWAGLPLFLFDTAGLRETDDPVERLGVARVAAVLEKVDLILHLIPAMDEGADPEIQARLEPYAWKVMEVRTFADQANLFRGDRLDALDASKITNDAVEARPTSPLTPAKKASKACLFSHSVNSYNQGTANGVAVSGLCGDLRALEDALKERFLGSHSVDACLGALATRRQRELLDEMVMQLEMLFQLHQDCPPEVPASLLQGLWGLLMRLTGEDRAESTLDQVFNGFCLGK